MSRSPVVVLGDVMVDVIARHRAPLAPGSDTPAHIQMRPGGSAANTAAWLGRLGAPVVFVGCVGDDALGRDAAQALASVGVSTELTIVPGVVTGTCVILVDAEGERTMLPDPGANGRLDDAALPGAAFARGGHLHVSGYAVMRGGSRETAGRALDSARAVGMTTSVDAASAAPLSAFGAPRFRDLVRGVDLMIVTLDEGEVLCGTREADGIARQLLAEHGEVVLKRGTDGASAHTRDGSVHRVPAARPPGPVVDTTGAGDAFAAALLASRMAGQPPRARLERACGLAARVVTQPGARP